MIPVKKNIEISVDNTYRQEIELETNIINIDKIYFTAKDTNGKRVLSKSLDKGISLLGNVITLTIEPSDTLDLKCDYDYDYDVKIIYNKVDKQTLMIGSFKVSKVVTMPSDEV